MKRALSGKMNVVPGAVTTVFDPVKAAAKANSVDQREHRLQKRGLQGNRSADENEEILTKRERLEALNYVTNADLFQKCDCLETRVLSEHDYTNRIEEVYMLHKTVLCQTDLTMAELEKIGQELKPLTTKLQFSKQEESSVCQQRKNESC